MDADAADWEIRLTVRPGGQRNTGGSALAKEYTRWAEASWSKTEHQRLAELEDQEEESRPPKKRLKQENSRCRGV